MLSPSEVLRETVRFSKKEWKTLFPYLALLALLAAIESFVNAFSSFRLYFVLAVVLKLISVWITVSFVDAIYQTLSGKKFSHFWLHLLEKKKVGLQVVAILVIFSLLVMAGSLFLLIPGIYLMFSLMFGMQECVIANKGVVESIKGSHNLVKGRWLDTAGKILLPLAVFVLIFFVIREVLEFVLNMINLTGAAYNLLALSMMIVSLILISTFTLLSTTMVTVIYLDLKASKKS